MKLRYLSLVAVMALQTTWLFAEDAPVPAAQDVTAGADVLPSDADVAKAMGEIYEKTPLTKLESNLGLIDARKEAEFSIYERLGGKDTEEQYFSHRSDSFTALHFPETAKVVANDEPNTAKIKEFSDKLIAAITPDSIDKEIAPLANNTSGLSDEKLVEALDGIADEVKTSKWDEKAKAEKLSKINEMRALPNARAKIVEKLNDDLQTGSRAVDTITVKYTTGATETYNFQKGTSTNFKGETTSFLEDDK